MIQIDALSLIFILYVQSTIFLLDVSAWVNLTSTMLGFMCLAQGHKALTPVRLKPAAPRSQVNNSITELHTNQCKFSMQKQHGCLDFPHHLQMHDWVWISAYLKEALG